MQHADKRQIAISLREVQSISNHKEIRNFELHVVGFNLFNAPRSLIQQHASLDTARLKRLQFSEHPIKRLPGIENVVHEQHVASAYIKTQFLRKNQFSRFGARSIARHPNEI